MQEPKMADQGERVVFIFDTFSKEYWTEYYKHKQESQSSFRNHRRKRFVDYGCFTACSMVHQSPFVFFSWGGRPHTSLLLFWFWDGTSHL